MRTGAPVLAGLLEHGQVVVHPFVIGNLALGAIRHCSDLHAGLPNWPSAHVVLDHDVMPFIELRGLFGPGIGYVDAHLLTAIRLVAGAARWTRGERLRDVAAQLGLPKVFAQ